MGEIYLHVCLIPCCMPWYTHNPYERQYRAVSSMVFNSIQALVHSWSFIIDQNIFPQNKADFFPCFFEQHRQTTPELPNSSLSKKQRAADHRTALTPAATTQVSKQVLSETTFHFTHLGETRYYSPIKYVCLLAD